MALGTIGMLADRTVAQRCKSPGFSRVAGSLDEPDEAHEDSRRLPSETY